MAVGHSLSMAPRAVPAHVMTRVINRFATLSISCDEEIAIGLIGHSHHSPHGQTAMGMACSRCHTWPQGSWPLPTKESSNQDRLDEEQTAFRRWQSTPPQGPVPGLRRALEEAGLSSYVAAVESWCCSEGAAFLAEVFEELEALSQALGLTPEQFHHMGEALQASAAAAGERRRVSVSDFEVYMANMNKANMEASPAAPSAAPACEANPADVQPVQKKW